jgi:hypothetical protein
MNISAFLPPPPLPSLPLSLFLSLGKKEIK